MNPTAWKLVYTLAAVAVYVISAWPPLAGISDVLHIAAGGLLVTPFAAPKHAQ